LSISRMLHLLTIVLAFIAGNRTMAHPLLGDTGMVSGRIISTSHNPANLAHIKYRHASFFLDFYRNSTFAAKFQGLKPLKKEESGIFKISPGTFASDVNFPIILGNAGASKGIAFSIFPIPPINLSSFASKQKIDNIPIYIFRQVDSISASIEKLNIKGGIAGGLAYRFGRLSLGITAKYFAADFDLKTRIEKTQQDVFTLQSSFTTASIKLGMRYNLVPGLAEIGLSSNIYELNDTRTQITAGSIKNSIDNDDGKHAFLPTFSAGMKFTVYRLNMYADLYYVPAKAENGFDLYSLRVGEKDVYATLSPSFGLEYRINQTASILSGYRYIAAKYGDGSGLDGGKIGFGPIEVTQIYFGSLALKPMHQYSTGIEYRLFKNKSSKKSSQPPFSMLLSFGGVYRTASRGVGVEGNIPATYVEESITFPLGITYFY